LRPEGPKIEAAGQNEAKRAENGGQHADTMAKIKRTGRVSNKVSK